MNRGWSFWFFEVERSKARSKLPHRLSRMLSDFVTLCLKCSDGSIKEAARASGTQKVNNTSGSRVTSCCWSLSLTSLLFHTPEGHAHCVQHQHGVLLYSIFVYMSVLLFRVACLLLLLCYYPQLSLEGFEGLDPVRYLWCWMDVFERQSACWKWTLVLAGSSV